MFAEDMHVRRAASFFGSDEQRSVGEVVYCADKIWISKIRSDFPGILKPGCPNVASVMCNG